MFFGKYFRVQIKIQWLFLKKVGRFDNLMQIGYFCNSLLVFTVEKRILKEGDGQTN